MNVITTSNVFDGQFHHVAGTLDGARLKIYVDTVLEGDVAYSGTPLGNTAPLLIGAWGRGFDSPIPGRFFSGLIDETAVFNRALSAGEIQAIYDAGSAGKCKTPSVPVPAAGNRGLVAMALAMVALVYLGHRKTAAST